MGTCCRGLGERWWSPKLWWLCSRTEVSRSKSYLEGRLTGHGARLKQGVREKT